MLITLITLISQAYATETSFKYGMGLIEQRPTGSAKTFTIERNDSILLYDDLRYNYQLGVNPDSGKQYGRKTSGMIATQLGVRPRSGNTYIEGYWGPCLITSPDSQLGGPFQFKMDAGIGVIDENSLHSYFFCWYTQA